MSTTKEILKTIGVMLIFLGILTQVIVIKFFSIGLIILICIIYLFLLKNNLEQLKNDYDYEKNEHDKKYEREIIDTMADLEKRGMTHTGEAVKKLGKLSAYKEVAQGQSVSKPLECPFGSMPIGEINQNYKDYENYRIKKFKLNFKSAKYKVLINLFKK